MVPVVRFDSLRTGRLVMRRWQDGDREPFAALNADPHTMRFFPGTLDRAASDAMIDRLEERFEAQGFGMWALEIASTGQFIGFTGLNPLPAGMPGGGGTEVGWRLARAAWHHGYATEAARAALDVAFGILQTGRGLLDRGGAQRAVAGGDAPSGPSPNLRAGTIHGSPRTARYGRA